MCYTFNDDKNAKKLDTYKTGARFGLRLTLNIEQYEYMIGPNTDAGIKVHTLIILLHLLFINSFTPLRPYEKVI